MRYLLLVAFLVLAVWVGYVAWQRRGADEGAGGGRRGGQRAVAVEVASPRRGEIRDVRGFSGTLRAAAEFIVAPKASGRLRSLLVDIADPVRQGQLVAELESEEYEQELLRARADLEAANADLEHAEASLALNRKEYERASSLRENRVLSESAFEKAESEYRRQEIMARLLRARLSERTAALRGAELRFGHTRIVADWGGAEDEVRYVGGKFVDGGAMASPTTPIISVVDVVRMRAVIGVVERDYPRMVVGQPAELRVDAYPGRAFPAEISRVSKMVDEDTRQGAVELRVANDDLALRPGMFVRAMIEFERKDDALMAPRAALVRRDGVDGVFAVDTDANTAKFVPVKLGILNDAAMEILSPEISSPVVTLGHHLLSDGVAIIIPAAGDGADGAGGGKGKPGGAAKGGAQ